MEILLWILAFISTPFILIILCWLAVKIKNIVLGTIVIIKLLFKYRSSKYKNERKLMFQVLKVIIKG